MGIIENNSADELLTLPQQSQKDSADEGLRIDDTYSHNDLADVGVAGHVAVGVADLLPVIDGIDHRHQGAIGEVGAKSCHGSRP